MRDKSSPGGRGYGVLMALGALVGFAVGLLVGQPSAGVVGGFVLGGAAALVLGILGR